MTKRDYIEMLESLDDDVEIIFNIDGNELDPEVIENDKNGNIVFTFVCT